MEWIASPVYADPGAPSSLLSVRHGPGNQTDQIITPRSTVPIEFKPTKVLAVILISVKHSIIINELEWSSR